MRELATRATVRRDARNRRGQDRSARVLIVHIGHSTSDTSPLAHAELVDAAMLLLGAGHETTATWITLGVAALPTHPVPLELLRAGVPPVFSAANHDPAVFPAQLGIDPDDWRWTSSRGSSASLRCL